MKLRLRWLVVGLLLALGGGIWAHGRKTGRDQERAVARVRDAQAQRTIDALNAQWAEVVERDSLKLSDRDEQIRAGHAREAANARVISQLQGHLVAHPVRLIPSDGGGQHPPDLTAVAPVPDPAGCAASLEACRQAMLSGVEPVEAPPTIELGMSCRAEQIEAAGGTVAARLWARAEAALDLGGRHFTAERPEEGEAGMLVTEDGRRWEQIGDVSFRVAEPGLPPLRRALELRGGVTTGPGFAAGASWYGARRVGWWVQGDYDPDPDRLTSHDYSDGELLSETTDTADRWKLAFGAAVRLGAR